MKSYTHLPTRVQAQQIKASDFTGPHPNPDHVRGATYRPVFKEVYIYTPEGELTLSIGDWIVRGINSELYGVADVVFKRIYVEDPEGDDRDLPR